MAAAYHEAARGLVSGGADLLVIETVFDTLNAKAAIFAVETLWEELGYRLPLIISGTITDLSGRTLSGQTVAAFWNSVRHARPLAVGLNCALGGRQLRPYAQELAGLADTFLSLYPNAGLPNAFGEYEETPHDTSAVLGELAADGVVNIVGGCCGTGPDHIAAIAAAVRGLAPRPVPVIERRTRLAGLEPLDIGPDSLFVNVGERTNVTGSRRFARLIREGQYGEAVEVARQQVESGAQVLDINMDEGMLDSEAAMTRFVRLLAAEPDISRVPFMLDSSKWSVIEAGLRAAQGRPVVNSISLKEGEAEFLRQARLARRYGAAVVVMAFDEQGQAETVERKVDIAQRAYACSPRRSASRRGHHLRPQHLRHRHGHRGAHRLRGGLHRGRAADQGRAARRAHQRRRLQRLLLLPRQRSGARGHPCRLPVPRHRGGAGHGHRQRRRAAGHRRPRSRPARARRGPRAGSPARRHRTAAARSPTGARSAATGTERDLAWREAPVEERLRHALVEGISDWIVEDTEEARLAADAAVARHRGTADGGHGRGRRPLRQSAACSCPRWSSPPAS